LWKKNDANSEQYKENFPRLLKETFDKVGAKGRQNLISGFRSCGIYPFNLEAGLKKLPQKKIPDAPGTLGTTGMPLSVSTSNSTSGISTPNEAVFHDQLVNLLEKERFGSKTSTSRGRRKKINVSPGKSVRGIHFGEEVQTSSDDDSETERDLDDYVSPSASSGEEDDPQPLPSSSDEMDVDDGSDEEAPPIKIADLKKDLLVIVTLTYSTGARATQKEHVRKYLGQVQKVRNRGKEVEVLFMKKYMNRPTEFVFVTPDNEENPELVPFSNISEIVHVPFKLNRGRFVFDHPILSV